MAVVSGIGMLILALTGARTLDEAEKIQGEHRRHTRLERSASTGKEYDRASFAEVQAKAPPEVRSHCIATNVAELCIFYSSILFGGFVLVVLRRSRRCRRKPGRKCGAIA